MFMFYYFKIVNVRDIEQLPQLPYITTSMQRHIFDKYGLIWHMLYTDRTLTPHQVLKKLIEYNCTNPDTYRPEELSLEFVYAGLINLFMGGYIEIAPTIWDQGISVHKIKDGSANLTDPPITPEESSEPSDTA
jgi:hypothetical protein